jgi:multidrug efflux system outer membrane protein
MRRRHFALSAAALAALLAGCANLAPAYQVPAAPIPAAWPAVQASAATSLTAPAPVDLGWQDMVIDPRLRQVIALALANNRDLRAAVLAITKARATYRIQSAAQSPSVSAGGSLDVAHTPAQASTSGVASTSRQYGLEVGLASYEVDLFGRVRNLKDAALESYLNTEEAQRGTRLSLVAEVATAWLTLAADRAQLALARDTLKSQQESYALTAKRKELGADSGLTLVQAQTSVESARGSVASYESQVRLDLNALQLLAGSAVPDTMLPAADVTAPATVLVAVPEALPSSVLQRRPDVLAAEHLLKGAYADIGAARAAFFPSISLTASAGTASRSLGNLFQGGAWSFLPSVTLPIFDGGANQGGLDSARAARDIQLATYEKTVQTAFREVADALAVRGSLDERLAAQQALVDAYAKTATLAQARFRNGGYSYLEVLDAQRSLYAAQQSLIALQLTEQSNRVALFKALGGGWRES